MGLRRQLVLISALTLVLPWAGCQSIRELERALHRGQSEALSAHARAVTLAIAHQPEQVADLDASAGARAPLYLHSLSAPALVDGYDEEWRLQGLSPRSLRIEGDTDADAAATDSADTGAGPLRVVAAQHAGRYYLLLDIHQTRPRYHRPGSETGDELLIVGDEARWLLQPEAPGSLVARRFEPSRGATARVSQVRGHWRETAFGYRVELSLPAAWARRHLGVGYRPAGGELTGNLAHALATAPPPVAQSEGLTGLLAVFAGPDQRLQLVDASLWRRAEAGAARTSEVDAEAGHWLLQWFYRQLLGGVEPPPLPATAAGRLQRPELAHALAGEPAWRRYRNADGEGTLLSAAYPVRVDDRVVGAVIAEETGRQQLALANAALQNVLLWGLGATAVVAATLIGYASWLSWRIRRLRRAAARVVGADGQLHGQFPAQWQADELGDLGRHFHQLFRRLREHTDYLRTLASKLSHELRTPLAVVRGSLDNLEQQLHDEQDRLYVHRAREGSERLSHLLTAMSAANRVEESIRGADRREVDLRALVLDMGRAYTAAYPQQRLLLEVGETPIVAAVAPELLVQALDKLVENAVDFCAPDGAVTLRLERSAGHAVITVSNDGPPLPDAMPGQLFESMVSMRPGTASGTHLGLGLYIVRLIAEFHGAVVEARNRSDGAGVSVSVSLPLGLH